MKKINLTFIAILLSTSFCFAQHFTNSGGQIYITSGTNLTLTGDFENLGNGEIENKGDLDVMGDWINNGTGGAIKPTPHGNVNFKGSSTQIIKGSTPSSFNKLHIYQDVELLEDVSVLYDMTLNSGKVNLLEQDLNYEGFIGINGTLNSYIIAEGTGKLGMFVDMTNPTEFPIGTVSTYTPLQISLNSFSDNYKANITTDVLANGNAGTTIPAINDCVNLTWNIEPNNPSTANYDLSVQWNASNEMPNFDRTQSAIGSYHAGQWNANTASAATGLNPYSQTLNGITYVGNFAVGDTDSPMAIMLDVIVDVKALLEGPYHQTEMLSLLNSNGLLPLTQPYNTAPWNYAGAESVAAIPNNNVVDWVMLEIRDAANADWAFSANAIERQAAFVLKDGSIVGMDGSSFPQFSEPIAQNLFLVIYHRNHLSVMSATPLTQTAGIYTYDFTSGINQAYSDDGNGQKEIATGVWGMYGGDGSGGGNITHYDRQDIWQPQSGTKGYLTGDYNLNGQVENRDKNDIWLENNNISTQVPE